MVADRLQEKMDFGAWNATDWGHKAGKEERVAAAFPLTPLA